MSGSTSAADIAERRKLEAQLREQKEGLNDTYYSHAMDSMSTALDDEMNSYQDARDKYIEQLEEMLEDAETLITNTIMDVMFNADVARDSLLAKEKEYGVYFSNALIQPWEDAAKRANDWKLELQNSMTSGEFAALIGEGGAITVFTNGVGNKLKGSWDKAKTAAKGYSDFLNGEELKNKFSGTLTTFGTQIQAIIDKWKGVKKASEEAAAAQLAASNQKVTIGGNDNKTTTPTTTKTPTQTQTSAKKYAGSATGYIILRDGTNVVKHYQTDRQYSTSAEASNAAKNKVIELVANDLVQYQAYRNLYPNSTVATQKKNEYAKNNIKWNSVSAFYKSGTTGTKKDQWAVTDEPEWGDELTLVPNESGNLSFLRKGTGVVPADMTKRLWEIAQMPPSQLGNTIITANAPNVSANTNAISLHFDAFIKAENINDATVDDLNKMVDQKINKFSKELNYSLKKFI